VLFEATRQAFCATGPDGRITFVNRAACDILGLSRDALLGQRLEQLLIPPADTACIESTPPGARRLAHLWRTDGTTRSVTYTADPLGPEGTGAGWVVHLEDVTELQRTSEALREAQRRLATLMANLPGAAYRCRNDASWTMEYMSDGCLALTGYPAGEFLGPEARSFTSITHPEDRERVWEAVQAAIANRTSFKLIFRIRHASGREMWVWEQGQAIVAPDGQVLALEGFITDITDRKQLEARALHSERMAAVGTLAAGVAHEVNNPLAFVQSNVDHVARVVAAGGPGDSERGEVLAALREAREGTERIRSIVRDLNSFSRAEDPRMKWLDLEDVLTSASSLAANEVRHRARLEREPGGAPPVYASEGRLVQVFVNLIVNAAHALPEGEADRHEIRLRTGTGEDGTAWAEVRDTGCGIPPELLPRLFEPFFTTKPAGRGTGLGLSICHTIVTGLGGRIEVESTPGRGSTFRVVLPAARGMPEAPPPEPEKPRPEPAVKRGRVLVIDDEELVGTALRRLLGRVHDVRVSTRADTALEWLLAGEQYDLILCDVMMPHLSGMDFHAALGERLPSAQERVVFLSGGAFSPAAREFLARIPTGRKLDKPFDPAVLMELLRERLESAA
jgi:PAS domain S-box-containing protein